MKRHITRDYLNSRLGLLDRLTGHGLAKARKGPLNKKAWVHAARAVRAVSCHGPPDQAETPSVPLGRIFGCELYRS